MTQLILVGSDSATDFFSLQIASAGGKLEDDVVIYGGDGVGGVINIYGTSRRDTFVVGANTASVNGNAIEYFGIERIRLVKNGGSDTTTKDDDVLAEVLTVLSGNPSREE